MFISSHHIDDAPLAKRMKLDGELSMLSVFTSTINCSVPAEKNHAIYSYTSSLWKSISVLHLFSVP